MDMSGYFEVVSTEDRVFHLRMKGFWTDEVATQIGPHFLAQFKAAVDSMGGQKFLVLVDTTDFRPPYQKAKELMSEIMKYASEHNLYRAVEVLPSAVTRLAVRLAAQDSLEDELRVIVSSVEEGWGEINKLKQSL